MKALVAIANYGHGNREYLDKLIEAYQQMPIDIHLVVLSNIPKDLGPEVEVRVGVPSENPWSLPFAHRPLFKERLNEYDLFVYSEDDTLLEWPVLERFVRSSTELRPDEIAGFMRTETGPDGRVYYSTSHSFFRWLPHTVRERKGKLWARFSNDHSALFVASRDQLRQAINSGGFVDEPHEGRYDMLCAAATDIYTRCSLERLICLDELERCELPHLPNKYIGKMGLPREEMQWQIEALRKVHQGALPSRSLYDPETQLPGGQGSKHSREQPDGVIVDLIGETPRRILVWGSGDGVAEADLASRGHEITVMPMDAVLGYSCEKRGLIVMPPDISALASLGKGFDVVIVRDGLHLIDDPEQVLHGLKSVLKATGRVIARVPHLGEIGLLRKRLNDKRFQMKWDREHIGATAMSVGTLKRLCVRAGFTNPRVRGSVPQPRRGIDRMTLGVMSKRLSPFLYAVADK